MNNKKDSFSTDNIYASELEQIDKFSFSRQVVDVFPDMINRSVPGYHTIIEGIGKIAKQNLPENAVVYDLGCSLGSASLAVAKNLADKSAQIYAIDNSQAMINRCQQHIAAFNFSSAIKPQLGDLNTLALEPCHLVIMNFTLQFISPSKRAEIITKISNALLPGGLLILSEKIQHPHHLMDETLVCLHHQFKRENGYSDLEISQKRSALEDVMILDSIDTHNKRLSNAGFVAQTTWFQHFNFMSLLAIKQ